MIAYSTPDARLPTSFAIDKNLHLSQFDRDTYLVERYHTSYVLLGPVHLLRIHLRDVTSQTCSAGAFCLHIIAILL